MSLFDRLGLPGAWRALARYTLLETDFGEGVSFIRLWERWKQDPVRPKRLHVVALSPSLSDRQTLRARLCAQTSPDQRALVDQLLAQWPLNLPGTHRLDFEGMSVTLTIGVGPIERTLPRLAVAVDAVLFSEGTPSQPGGLAPVWLENLPRVARDRSRVWLALPEGKSRRGCTEWTRSLVSDVQTSTDTMLRQDRSEAEARHAVVVGAGVAGAGVAHCLALRGWRVQILDVRQRRTQEHGGHRAAALTPMVTRDDDVRARLSRAGSLRAQARWSHVGQEVLWRCGALQLQRVSGRIVDLARLAQGLGFPGEWVRYVDRAQASEIAGLPLDRGGLYFPTAARINPEKLIEALLVLPNIERLDVQVERFDKRNGFWEVMDEVGEVRASAPELILAGAFGTQDLLRRSQRLEPCDRLAAMHALGGEITMLPRERLAGGPRCIVSGDGYVLPSLEGQCVVGSSYVHGAERIQASAAGARDNIARAAALLGQPRLPEAFNNSRSGLTGEAALEWEGALEGETPLKGWAGWRAVLPGRLPVVGPSAQEEGLWLATGFASRGLTWSSLAGDLIASALNGEPLPLERDIMDKISQT